MSFFKQSDKDVKNQASSGQNPVTTKKHNNQQFTFVDNFPYEAKTITLSQEELEALKKKK
jgi:hypothetical protein